MAEESRGRGLGSELVGRVVEEARLEQDHRQLAGDGRQVLQEAGLPGAGGEGGQRELLYDFETIDPACLVVGEESHNEYNDYTKTEYNLIIIFFSCLQSFLSS